MYFGSQLSDNISVREPEGYLICLNVPIARTGQQEYLNEELGFEGVDIVKVNRPEEEVFSDATIASFEGMPVTNDHPTSDEGVDKDNIAFMQKGHAQNIRRGTGDESDLLLADLIITDPLTIEAVQKGKREISCGYNYELVEDEDGNFTQRQIRGNHIAIVDKGRAGHRVCIKDSAVNEERREPQMDEKSKKRKAWARMLFSRVKDSATPEEIEEAVDAVGEAIAAESQAAPPMPPVPDPAPTTTPVDETQAVSATSSGTDDEPDKLDIVIDLLNKLIGQKTGDEDPEEDPLAKLEQDLDEAEAEQVEEELTTPDEDPDEAESHFVDPAVVNNEEDEDVTGGLEEYPVMDCGSGCVGTKKSMDAARAALRAIKPVIAALPPEQRKKAVDAAVAQIRKEAGLGKKAVRNDYIAIQKAKKAKDSQKKPADPSEIGKRIMAARNCNYKK